MNNKDPHKKMWYHYQKIIFSIVPYNIALCCQLFFHSWLNFEKDVRQKYAENMSELTNNEGIILCPDCLIKKVKVEAHGSLLQ